MIVRVMFKGLSALVVVLSLSLLTACRKELREDGAPVRRTVVFGASAPETRSTATLHEGDVKSLDVLVFRGNRMLDAHVRSTGPLDESGNVSSVTADVTTGIRLEWYVFANAPEGAFDGVLSKDDLFGRRVVLDGDADGYFPMLCSGEFTEGPGEGAVSVGLERYACKVTVRSVTLDWPDAFSISGGARLGRIALVNVVAERQWTGEALADPAWYNAGGLDGNPSPMTVADLGGVQLLEGVPQDAGTPLYCMPNEYVNNDNAANSDAWTPRPTRVAVEVVIGGVSNWYPVMLPRMMRNTHYVVNNLRISGPGSIGPDWPVEREDMTFTVNINRWEDQTVVAKYGD